MRSAGVSPTRRASRATLPARGRDQNGATRHNEESPVHFAAYDDVRLADARSIPPSMGEGGSRSEPGGEQKGLSYVQR